MIEEELQKRIQFLEKANADLHYELSQFNRTVLLDTLREIDAHIKTKNEPISYIVKTLRENLPEYKNDQALEEMEKNLLYTERMKKELLYSGNLKTILKLAEALDFDIIESKEVRFQRHTIKLSGGRIEKLETFKDLVARIKADHQRFDVEHVNIQEQDSK